MANTVIVDDTDSRVKFSKQWFISGGDNEYDSTTHGTRTAGQTVTFTFSGSSVAVYGTISDTGAYKDPPVSTYSIDGSTPYTFTAGTYSKPQYKQRYFASPKLSDGEHTLVITSTLELAFFWIDYFEITPSAEAKITPAAAPAVSTIITTAITTPDSHITTKNSGDNPLVNASPTTSPTTTTTKASTTSKGQSTTLTTILDASGHTVTLTLDGSSSTGLPLGASSAPSDVPSSAKPGAPLGAIIGGAVGASLDEGDISSGITPFTVSAPAMGQAYDQGSLPQSDSTGPYSGMGYGYVVHGGTKAHGMHQSQPSRSESNSTTGLLLNAERDTSESSTSFGNAGLVPATKATDFGGAPVVRVESQPPVSPSGMHGPQQSLSIMPLYDDVPPAYIQSPPGPRGPL
ncbi:hypothetical protein H0H87_001803 [Tephrocybe sp. NHM501043]|nr:hypothetical protein H0H87_001803 [Tephrocybe sp. NHM501043]